MKTDLKSKDTNESLKHTNHSGIFVMSGNVVLNEEEGTSTNYWAQVGLTTVFRFLSC